MIFRKIIPYSRPRVGPLSAALVGYAAAKQTITQGPKVEKFELELTRHTGSSYSVTTNSATSALHIGLLALGLTPGKLVWLPSNTFVATANAVRACGGEVEFIDIDPTTFNLDMGLLETRLAEAQLNSATPFAVIPVHFGGNPVDLKQLRNLADRYDFKVLEDASHAFGSSYGGHLIGDCKFTDAAVFSFHAVKPVTTAEGGALMTNSLEVAERAKMLRSHGITRDPREFFGSYKAEWHYEQHELGYNYRLSDVQCVLGIAQIRRYSAAANSRAKAASYYRKRLGNQPIIRFQRLQDGCTSSNHLFPIRVPAELRDDILRRLRSRGIMANVIYPPVHLQPYYLKSTTKVETLPETEMFSKEVICLPCFPGIRRRELKKVADSLLKGLAELAAI